MNLVGTVANDDDQTSQIEAAADDYDSALLRLKGMVPEGSKLISIRVTR